MWMHAGFSLFYYCTCMQLYYDNKIIAHFYSKLKGLFISLSAAAIMPMGDSFKF